MGEEETMRVREERKERAKSILIPLIYPGVVLPTGMFTCTHTHADTHLLVRYRAVCYTPLYILWSVTDVLWSGWRQWDKDSVRLGLLYVCGSF